MTQLGQLVFPRDPFLFLSSFAPLLHIHTVTKAIEMANEERAGRRAVHRMERLELAETLSEDGAEEGEAGGAEQRQRKASMHSRRSERRNERQQQEYGE